MGSNGFSTEGLRILVVDGDKNELRTIESMLKKLNHKVITCNCGYEAIQMLGEKNERFKFEIVMTDVNIGDVDGFDIIKYASLKLKVPTIMMSEDGETSKVMKGIQCGACVHLSKPIEMERVQSIWQHVYRKRLQQQPLRIQERFLTLGSIKKPRLVWANELENKFNKVVNEIGIEKATPKIVHALMNDPSLTRENVASHLQKFKLKMSKRAATTTQVFQQPKRCRYC